MATVFDVLVQAARNLDALEEGVATAGSTSTLTDLTLLDEGWDEDASFNGGTLYILAHAGGAAPQGQSRVPTNYIASTGVITVAPVFSVAVAANDRYGVTTNRYPRNTLAGKLNEFLSELGDVPTEDVSLTTLANTLEYSLPVAAKLDVREVWIAQLTAAPWNWRRLATYRYIYAGAGVAGKLIFPYQLPVGFILKVVYMGAHPAVYADSDVISDYIADDWAAMEVASRAARWRLDQPGEDRDALIAKINDLSQQAARAEHRRRPLTPAVTPRLPYFPGS